MQTREETDELPARKTSRALVWTLILANLLPALSALVILSHYALSLPEGDDYASILGFAGNYAHLHTAWAKFLFIIGQQHNEYKYVCQHVLLASELDLTRHINFNFLNVIDHLTLLALGCLLWRISFRNLTSVLARCMLSLPISLIFFSINYWDTPNYPTACLQYLPTVLLALLGLHLLTRSIQQEGSLALFLLACAAADLSGLFSANGFVLAPLGLMILATNRLWRRGALWCISFAVPLAIFFYHYKSLPHPPGKLLLRPIFVLAFLGDASPTKYLAIPLGCVIIAVFIHSIWARYDRINPVLFYMALWLIITGALVAVARGGLGLYMSLAIRYRINSDLMIIFAYVYLISRFAQPKLTRFGRKAFFAALALSIIFCLQAQYTAYRALAEHRLLLVQAYDRYLQDPSTNSPSILIGYDATGFYDFERKMERDTLNNAIGSGIYVPPANLPAVPVN